MARKITVAQLDAEMRQHMVEMQAHLNELTEQVNELYELLPSAQANAPAQAVTGLPADLQALAESNPAAMASLNRRAALRAKRRY